MHLFEMKLLTIWSLLLSAAAGANQTEYEYVVIGSGPGGGTLAANLARDGHSVFLIEAGDDQGHNLTEVIPGFNTIASETPGFAWNFFVNHFKNETQARRDNKYTYRLTNGSLYVGLQPPESAKPLGILYPRGSTLGGSSEVNGMNWALQPDNDWRYIANLTDDDSWRPEQMRQYFMELERNEYLPEGVPGHGYDGVENNLTYVTGRPGVVKLVEEASRMIEGINIKSTQQLNDLLNRDMNRINTSRYEEQGVYRFPVHIDNLKRRSGACSRIADTLAATDENGDRLYPLTLSTHSLASKVLFEHRPDRKPRAVGVEYLYGEALYSVDARYNPNQTVTTQRVYASKEVIVAGGSFNTPQILKLSGIGPAQELQRLGIPVVVDLPAVGNHMRDNYEGGVVVQANVPFENNPFANCTYNLSNQSDPCLAQWENDHTGPYGEGGAPLTMWYRSKQSQNNDSDIFFFGGASAVFRGYFPGYSREQVPPSTFYWSMVKMKPRNAAGTVELRSTDPREAPFINFNYFEQGGDEDLAALAESATLALSIFNATGAPYTPYKVIEPTPGIPLEQALKDDMFSHHVSSTCRMGPKGDRNYCVDSRFRVNGVDNLRVVDASVFPIMMGGFPVGPTFIISRKAYHVITADYECYSG